MPETSKELKIATSNMVELMLGSEPVEMLTRFAPHFYAWSSGPEGKNIFQQDHSWNALSLTLTAKSRALFKIRKDSPPDLPWKIPYSLIHFFLDLEKIAVDERVRFSRNSNVFVHGVVVGFIGGFQNSFVVPTDMHARLTYENVKNEKAFQELVLVAHDALSSTGDMRLMKRGPNGSIEPNMWFLSSLIGASWASASYRVNKDHLIEIVNLFFENLPASDVRRKALIKRFDALKAMLP